VDIDRVRAIAHVCLDTLETSKARLNDLNVYPVPDGDTGTNMTATLRAVVGAIDLSEARSIAALGEEATRAALRGASGNSGVILSQIVRGFVEGVGSSSTIDGDVLARGLRAAAAAAYRTVPEPVEGTMLTVVREIAEEAESPDVRALPAPAALRRVLEGAELSLARTPQLLPVLQAVGVVDAGGAGLVEILRGLVAGVTGEASHHTLTPTEVADFGALHLEESRFRYCTVYMVEGERLDADVLRMAVQALGDSVLVVGDVRALKVHVHTDDPGAALAIGTGVGTIDAVEISDMRRQAEERDRRLAAGLRRAGSAECGVVAVVCGAGNQSLFASLGAHVVDGGETMNPSTAQILAGIETLAADDVIVLPNNPNVVLGAEQAADLSAKKVSVLPSRSLQAGLAALAEFLPSERPTAENVGRMLEAIAEVATGEVTVASRDVVLDGVAVRESAWLGLVDDKAVRCADAFDEVATGVVDRLLADGRGVLTILTGQGVPDLESLLGHIAAGYPRVEVDVHDGGQPHYPLLLLAQ
jgi:uncharacterized protein